MLNNVLATSKIDEIQAIENLHKIMTKFNSYRKFAAL